MALLLIVGLVVVGLSVGFVVRSFQLAASQRASATLVAAPSNRETPDLLRGWALSKPQQAAPGLPVALAIPAIGVEAPITHVGRTPDVDMAAPVEPGDTAWYEPGPRPGENGSAVIAGHFGTWQNGDSGVFNNLYELRRGDTVYVTDDEGQRVAFVVRESRRFDPDADATDVFISDDGVARLNLITCEGDWSEATQSYSKRLVVFTERE